MGGDDEINDDDEETPLDEDGDGEGVDGVGDPRVIAVAEIFLAVNDNGKLLLPPPNVNKDVAVGLTAVGLLLPPASTVGPVPAAAAAPIGIVTACSVVVIVVVGCLR